MAPMVAFWISREDYDKLYAIKEEDGKNDMTGSEYVQELLKDIIRQRKNKEQLQTNDFIKENFYEENNIHSNKIWY